jgi:hypothetical protein
MDPDKYGRIAFEAYKKSKEGTTYDNKPIPEWGALGDEVRAAWIAAANAVIEALEPGGPAATE